MKIWLIIPILIFFISFGDAYAQNTYDSIDWFEIIGFFISNFWLSIQLIGDQGNVDSTYDMFADIRNSWINDSKSPSTSELQALTLKANSLVATKHYCNILTVDDVRLIIKAQMPYDKLNDYCNIPSQLDDYIRDRLV